MTTAQHTLSAISAILDSGEDRALTQQEKEELRRLCKVLEGGIFDRPIYNYAARAFSKRVSESGLFETGRITDLASLLETVESLQLMAR